jgi:AraC family transcriptional regulator
MLAHSVDKYVTGTMLESSNATGWTNILAERWSHEAGRLPSLTPRHTEIAILMKGRGVVDRIGAGMRQHTFARRGTIWLCPAGIEEEFISVDEPLNECLHLFLPGKPFNEVALREFGLDPSRIELRYETIDQDPFIEYAAREIGREMAHQSAAGRLLVESLTVALSAHLIRHYPSVSVRSGLEPREEKPLDARRLERVRGYIEFHLDEEFSVAELASVACMSVAHFARAFRAATGKTPHAYVSEKRLVIAKTRLADDNWSINDVAHAAGFSSQANFTRAFRQATGMTPAKYKTVRAAS